MKREEFLRKYFLVLLLIFSTILLLNIFIWTLGGIKLKENTVKVRQRVEKEDKEIQRLKRILEVKEKEVENFKKSLEVIETLKNNIFETRSKRFMKFQEEIKKIVEEANMSLNKFTYSYSVVPKERDKENFKDAFVEVSMVLPLEGTYSQIKKVISLLENSGHFITIEGIDISQTTQGSSLLSFKVAIKTYFVYEEEEDIIEEKI